MAFFMPQKICYPKNVNVILIKVATLTKILLYANGIHCGTLERDTYEPQRIRVFLEKLRKKGYSYDELHEIQAEGVNNNQILELVLEKLDAINLNFVHDPKLDSHNEEDESVAALKRALQKHNA